MKMYTQLVKPITEKISSKYFIIGMIFTLSSTVLFFSSCQNQELENVQLDPSNTPMPSVEGVFDKNDQGGNYINLTTIPNPKQNATEPGQEKFKRCVISLPPGESAYWDWDCFNSNTCSSTNNAIDLLEKYIKCFYPPLIDGCYEYEYANGKYFEGGVDEVCTTPDGFMNPWEYLDWGNPSSPSSNCNISLDHLEAFGDYIIANGIFYAPGNYSLYGVEIFWTSWTECSYAQTHPGCQSTSNLPYPCGSLFWSNSPTCSLCKDICETRGIGLRFKYFRECRLQS